MNLYEKYEKGEFKKVGSKKIMWEGQNKRFDVVLVPIKDLKYNVLNGRIAELDLNKDIDPNVNVATYKSIKNSIVASSKGDIERLGKDIGKSKLKEPLIINKDGIIVDGNRRYTAINMLLSGEIKPFSATDVSDLDTVEAVILDASSDSKNVKILEYSIQYDDMKKHYDPISRAFDFARSHHLQGMSIDEIAESTGIKKAEIQKDIRTVELIRIYLSAANADGDISLAIQLKLDGPMKEIASTVAYTEYFKNNQQELVDVITIAKQSGGDVTRIVRDMVKGRGPKETKANITNDIKVKSKIKSIAEDIGVNKIMEAAATATSTEEKVKILTNKTDAKQEIITTKKLDELASYQLDSNEKNKRSKIISEFLEFVKSDKITRLDSKEKEKLNKIIEVLNDL